MSTPAQNSGSEAIINLDAAMYRLGNDIPLLHDLAEFYLEDAPGLLQNVQAGIEAEDFDLVIRSAHSIKGLSSNFDAHGACEVARTIEQTGRQSDLDSIREQLPVLIREVQKVITALKTHVLK